MIVTCPSCATRYLVDTRKLGATGRLVRCANCKHTWHQESPAEQPLRVDLMDPESDSMIYPEGRRNLPALPPRRRGFGKILATLLLLVILCGLGGAGLLLARGPIVAYWPPAARIYAHLGLGVLRAPAPIGLLELRNVTPRRATDATGTPILAIDGEVANPSSGALYVPLMKATLRDANDQPLTSWTFDPAIGRLSPGGSAAFHTSTASPPDQATGVIVSFDSP
jgi:predicted Zn finger-like uncharacterized protein